MKAILNIIFVISLILDITFSIMFNNKWNTYTIILSSLVCSSYMIILIIRKDELEEKERNKININIKEYKKKQEREIIKKQESCLSCGSKEYYKISNKCIYCGNKMVVKKDVSIDWSNRTVYKQY